MAATQHKVAGGLRCAHLGISRFESGVAEAHVQWVQLLEVQLARQDAGSHRGVREDASSHRPCPGNQLLLQQTATLPLQFSAIPPDSFKFALSYPWKVMPSMPRSVHQEALCEELSPQLEAHPIGAYILQP